MTASLSGAAFQVVLIEASMMIAQRGLAQINEQLWTR